MLQQQYEAFLHKTTAALMKAALRRKHQPECERSLKGLGGLQVHIKNRVVAAHGGEIVLSYK